MKKAITSLSILCLLFTSCSAKKDNVMKPEKQISKNISLAGKWMCRLDPNNVGAEQKWFSQNLETPVILPGSLNQNGLGQIPNINTKWTSDTGNGNFNQPKYKPYHSKDNFKFPFWLTPSHHYVGAAWYQKQINIPDNWAGENIKLNLERCHWETKVWLDDKYIGTQNSLCVNHIYNLGKLTAGTHRLTVCVDNTVKIEIGNSAHSISDQTQTNWNGIIGAMALTAVDDVEIADVQVLPDIKNKIAKLKIEIANPTKIKTTGTLKISAKAFNTDKQHIVSPMEVPVNIAEDGVKTEIDYPMSDNVLLWDEFSPALYKLTVALKTQQANDSKTITFGMRQIGIEGKQFTINNRRIFIRGTLECCIFPLTGYPPTDVAAWERHIKIAKSYGLNQYRFHSWCPPEAAFEAADKLGFYFQIEGPVWGYVGQNEKTDKFVYAECNRILKQYANHPSFIMMAYGNEPWGDNHKQFLAKLVDYLNAKEDRVLFTSGSGWPALKENQFHVLPAPRAQHWGAGLKGRFNSQPPATNVNYQKEVAKYPQPTVSHEIGQWCVYPNFDEIKKYTGLLKAKNFEIFRDFLKNNNMLDEAHDFLMASGKLQVLLYKEEIEAALRTPDFAGFELLDLHDFPGQGTALVGVVDAFYDPKPYVTAKQYHRFCNDTVPLAAMDKLVWQNNETFTADILVSHFAPEAMHNAIFKWNLKTQNDNVIDSGSINAQTVPIASGTKVGTIKADLKQIKKASQLKLTISIDRTDFENDWNIWVYPADLKIQIPDDILITKDLDDNAKQHLAAGKKVLLMPGSKYVKGDQYGLAPTGFSTIFWNTAYTGQQQPHTMGILCNPKHKALADLPTDFHSDWQWWYINKNSRAMIMNDLPADLRPIVQVVDDWFKARRLGLVFEANVNSGKLLVTSIDLPLENHTEPVTYQMLYSLIKYMDSPDFSPQHELSAQQVMSLFRTHTDLEVVYTDSQSDDNPGLYAVDGDPATIWHTSWQPMVPLPHEIQIKLPKQKNVTGITYLPRQDMTNGRIKDYEIYSSIDGKNWGQPIAKGAWKNNAQIKAVMFDKPVKAQYIRLVALSEVKGNQYTSAAEIGVILE